MSKSKVARNVNQPRDCFCVIVDSLQASGALALKELDIVVVFVQLNLASMLLLCTASGVLAIS